MEAVDFMGGEDNFYFVPTGEVNVGVVVFSFGNAGDLVDKFDSGGKVFEFKLSRDLFVV